MLFCMLGLSDTFTNRHDEMNHAEYGKVLLKGRTADIELSRLVRKHGVLHTSSRTLRGANMCYTNKTQQMSACDLLTNTAWRWKKPEMEGDLAIRIHSLPRHQAAHAGLTAQHHCHLHQA